MLKCFLTVAIFIAVSDAAAVGNRHKRQSLAYVLPAGAEEVVGDIKTTFTCSGKPYGYYADTDNECEIFHICNPLVFPDGRTETFTFSFFCGNQTIFNQETLVCTYPEEAIPCQDAALFYIINDNFGKQVWHTTPQPISGYSDRHRQKREATNLD